MKHLTRGKQVNYHRLGMCNMSNIFDIKLGGNLCDQFLKCYEIWGSCRFKSLEMWHFVVGQVALKILKDCIALIRKDW